MKPNEISWQHWLMYNYYFVAGNYLGEKITDKYFKSKKQHLYQAIANNKEISKRGELIPTSSIECDDFSSFIKDKNQLTSQPLIFRGKAKNWDCTKKWSKAFFSQKLGNYQTDIIDNVGFAEENTVYTETDMANFVNNLMKDKKNYLRFSRIVDDNPELKNDLDVDFLNTFKRKYAYGDSYYLFMGEAGTKTEMHHAIPAAVFIQIKGKKKWTLYPPEERILLDPVAKGMPYHYSKANPNQPNDPYFPLLKHTKYYQFELNEGDIMWMPPFYWHYVENPTASIGLAFKFLDLAMAFKLSKVCFLHYFTATNPNIISSYLHNRKTNHDLMYEKKKKKK